MKMNMNSYSNNNRYHMNDIFHLLTRCTIYQSIGWWERGFKCRHLQKTMVAVNLSILTFYCLVVTQGQTYFNKLPSDLYFRNHVKLIDFIKKTEI